MFKNVASQKLTVFVFDATTNLPKTGDAANLTAYVDKDDAGVNALTDTSATEKDSTNAKGYYIFDLAQAETNADKLLFSCKSSTANIVVVCVPAVVYTIPASWIVPSNLTQILGTTLTETAGQIAAGFKKFFNIATPQATMDHGVLVDTVTTYTGNTPQTGDAYARLGAPAGASVSIDIAALPPAVEQQVFKKQMDATYLGEQSTSFRNTVNAIKSQTDNLPPDPADASDLVALFNAIPAAVWGYGTRTLSNFGTLIADIWANASRTLTAFGFTVPTSANATETGIKATTDKLEAMLEHHTTYDRFKATALEEAPAGGGGGDGTLYGENGSVTFTYTVFDVDGTTPLAGATVFVSADAEGTQRSQAKITDALGRVQFDLDPSDVFFWAFYPGRAFNNPDPETVS